MTIHNGLTDVLTITINGEAISDNIGDHLSASLCYGNTRADRVQTWSTSPVMPDNYQQYADWATYGSAKNPLAAYGENNGEDTRGGFPIEVVDSKTFRVVITEPVMMSPFFSGIGCQEEGFINVNQFNITYRWKSNLSTALSHSILGNVITNVSTTMYRAPEMLTTYITPDLTQRPPQLQVLPYHKPQLYVKDVGTLISGETRRVISDSIKLSQIPRKLYLFCRHKRSTMTQETSDSFLRINNLNVLWNNQSGLFSSATPQDLYEISRRNGCNLSWSQWYQYRGSVLCIEFGKDIGLLDNEAAGVQGQYTIQIQMDVENVSLGDFECEFFTNFLLEGTFSIAENMGRASLGNLTQAAVLQSKESPEVVFADYENIVGGSFWSKLKSIVNKVATGVGKAAQVATPIVGALAPELAPIVAGISTASGLAKRATGGRLAGGRLAGGRMLYNK